MSVAQHETTTSAELRERLTELTARHGVPAASLAVLADGEVTTAAAGVLNLATGVAATEDSLFHIGSITKLYTGTLVMQLVDEGRVDLDEPAVTYLPELKVADPEVTRTVTLRHLLNHTSGISGDHFPDLGRGDDVVARYVESCAELVQTHPLGATLSYCNSGFVIAGRVIEELTGESWDAALANRLLKPLGVQHTFTLPEDVLRFRSALGHFDEDGATKPVGQWQLPRSCGPCGLICATAADVVAFGRMHIDGGRALDGTQVLSPESVAAMRAPAVANPDPHTMGTHFGVAWAAFDGVESRVFGHNGGTIGQAAFFRIVPDAGVALALLTNGGHHVDLYEELVPSLLEELAGVPHTPPLEPPATPVDVPLDRHLGTYERHGNRIVIERGDSGLVAKLIGLGPLSEVFPDPPTLELVPLDEDRFLTRAAGERSWTPMTFYRLEDGGSYVHYVLRATPKVD